MHLVAIQPFDYQNQSQIDALSIEQLKAECKMTMLVHHLKPKKSIQNKHKMFEISKLLRTLGGTLQ